jgi:signal transduction histidine kinase
MRMSISIPAGRRQVRARLRSRLARFRRLTEHGRSIGLGALAVGNSIWHLQQLVSGRRLRRERQRALDLASFRGAFLNLASHEIRTPLAIARGYVDIVRSGTLGTVSEEVGTALGSVDSKLVEIEELVTHMIDTARLEAGREQLRMEPVDLRELLGEALSRTADLRGPEHPVVVADEGRPLIVLGDRFRLRTVLANLITNAVKYSPSGGEIRCTVWRRRRRAEVTVADRGIGFEPGQAERIFQPFTRLDRGAGTAPSGMGLGLHVAREAARAHGGDLTARPRDGGGAEVVLSLPLRR